MIHEDTGFHCRQASKQTSKQASRQADRQTDKQTNIHTRIYVYVYVYVYVYAYGYTYAYVYVMCMCMYMYVLCKYKYICMYIDILHTSLNVPSPNVSPMIFTATPSGLIQGAIKKFCSTAAEAQKRPSDMGGSSCGAPFRSEIFAASAIGNEPINNGTLEIANK